MAKLTSTLGKHRCSFCLKRLATAAGLSKHLTFSKACGVLRRREERRRAILKERVDGDSTQAMETTQAIANQANMEEDSAARAPSGFYLNFEGQLKAPESRETHPNNLDDDGENENNVSTSGDSRQRRITVPFPGPAGSHKGNTIPKFDAMWQKFMSSGPSPASDLLSPPLWELARWLLSSGLSASSRDAFFKLAIVSRNFEYPPLLTDYDRTKGGFLGVANTCSRKRSGPSRMAQVGGVRSKSSPAA